MPIRPIDLQTILMQMSQVGRDQAIEKDGPALQNAIQGAVAQRKEIESKDAVRRPEDPKEGPKAVKERGGRSRPHGGTEGEGQADGEETGEPHEEVVRDPSLGGHVDFSG